MFAGSCLAEERVEGVVSSSDGLVARHLTVWLNAMLQTVKFPAGIAHLHSGLADMDADALTLQTFQEHTLINAQLHFQDCKIRVNETATTVHHTISMMLACPCLSNTNDQLI